MSNSDLLKIREFDLPSSDNFNLMQYLGATEAGYDTNEEDGSMVSPTSSAGSMNQQQMHRQNPNFQVSFKKKEDRRGTNNRRLPDSPPMTDLCGNASTTSSSSHHSDPMFSPNEFNNYSGANNNNNPSMILGVHDMAQQQQRGNMMTSQQVLQQQRQQQQQQQNGQNYWNQNNGQQTPQWNVESSFGYATKESRMDTPCETPRNITSFSGLDGFPDENYSHQQAIRFSKFQEEQWNPLYDINGVVLQQLQVHVVADKGFNYSNTDNCFVNQKKNHFQVSVNVEASDIMPPHYVFFNNRHVRIRDFKLAFSGVKAEMTTSEITIRQSRADRKPHPHTPVLFEIQERRMTKVCVPRLHFSETTLNNQRKNFRPNPEQRYFLLVVRLFASIDDDNSVLIQSYASEKVIVRATNPGSFDPPDSDVAWQRNGHTLCTPGNVAIGTDRQAETARLTVAGDIYCSGRVINPSDIRLKEGISEKETAEAIENLLKLRVVDYRYKDEVANVWGLDEQQRQRTGLIAQELQAVLPDAVRDIGDYLTIDEGRVFYETVMATQQLCRMTGDLDNKIDEKVAEISKRLSEYAIRKKLASSMGSNLNGDNKSLSYSRCSLTSTATNATSQQSRRQRNKKSKLMKQAESCGNRLSQGTVVTLVSIMAACLLAMSALYILDWHNRNYGYHQHHDPTSSKSEVANLVVPCKSIEVTIKILKKLIKAVYMQPDALILLEKCYTPSCKTYCCTDAPPIVEDTGAIATHGLHDDAAVAPSEPVNRTNAISKMPVPDHISFGTGVEIKIPMLNVTLDQRYCIDKSCNKKRGVFNIYVPVSKFMSDASLEIEINIPKNKVIGNCGALHQSDFNHKYCPFSKKQQTESPVPTSKRLFDNIYEISAGSYVQSAYRYRVGYSTESCFTDEANGSYEEYNLIFYRTCILSSS
ncbi:Protein CBR-PQN-47 [Caenorhabditis briggsae]|uniref:Protein CBR-PQN-47 n=1 Tax=Caenorhabditis briggsae TaxID=6238 RepID=A8WST8_CAEBR|nr:Protein CBR-PQN-47 [Caenorhabditis briggsae]CAP23547.2 Protein CBR-PQN-47 [Caenorhabditis briggsae]